MPNNVGPAMQPFQDAGLDSFLSATFVVPLSPQTHLLHPQPPLPEPLATPRIKPNGFLAKLGVPCQQPGFEDYGRCFNYYANGCYNTCQFVAVDDIEDFM